MKIQTKNFGEVEIADNKIITFDKGIIGFPELKHFTMLHDEEKGSSAGIHLDYIRYPETWNIKVSREQGRRYITNIVRKIHDAVKAEKPWVKMSCSPVGTLTPENILVMVTVTVPSDLTKMTVNLQGPFVINVEERKACQIILEGNQYPVKFPIYDILKSRKAGE